MSTTPRKKVPVKIKKEARRLFESGMNMYDVAMTLKLNLNTLYNISSKEGWQKGRLEELFWVKEQEIFIDKIIRLREPRKQTYRDLSKGLTQIIKEEQTNLIDGKIKLSVNQSISLEKHAKALQTNYQLEKELYGLRTPEEEIDLEIKRIKLEQLKRTLEKSSEDDERTVALQY
ncbi:MAG: hypothetical protein ACRCYA_14000 [Cetobacterium sp.]|uniref:hypothetical protein n=1 Tax=Cetobacterium sp. TaxID=2071632 RepID=UPI003F3F12A1